MERKEMLEELKSLMGQYMHPEEKGKLDTITEASSFITDLNMDSVDLVDIVINAESKFNIQIENESIGKMTTVGKCLDIISEKLKEKSNS